jgi:hypothetical protein
MAPSTCKAAAVPMMTASADQPAARKSSDAPNGRNSRHKRVRNLPHSRIQRLALRAKAPVAEAVLVHTVAALAVRWHVGPYFSRNALWKLSRIGARA